MRIVIDMQGAQTGSRFRGIGRYTMSFTQAIVRNCGEHQVFLALSGLFPETIEPIRAAFDGLLPQKNICVWYAPGPVMEDNPANDERRKVAELIREAFLASLQPDVIHVTSFFEGYVENAVTSIRRFDWKTPVSVSLYDLIPHLNQDHYLKPNARYSRHYLRKFEQFRQAAAYLAISEFTRQEGLQHLDVDGGSIFNVSTAIESSFRPIQIEDDVAAKLRLKFGLRRPYVLYTGGSDERKNLPRLIQAFASLPLNTRAGHQLLLAGKMVEGDIVELKRQAESVGLKSDELCFTGYVTDEELVQLYNLCRLFVFPSWHEGFGLPALEAMACGAAVIGANSSSLPEVIGLEGALFDPLDFSAISKKMAQVLANDEFCTELRAHGLRRAKLFSWDESAKRAINVFENYLGAPSQQPSSWAEISAECEHRYRKLIGEIAAILQTNIGPSDTELTEIAICIAKNRQQADRIFRSQVLPESITWRLEGPFDSSYSLALLNRETARALETLGHRAILHSTEGPGDFAPSAEFMEANPDLKSFYARSLEISSEQADVSSRNLYPPRVADMNCRLNLFHCYGWEETALPNGWVESFNDYLQGIVCMSRYVAKILIDNGVTVPLAVSGIGVDHWERIRSDDKLQAKGKAFRFLHVSSCFPRKGADIMLEAYGRAFTIADDVTLVIKTFPNPHNEIHNWFASAKAGRQDFPDVLIIEDDLGDSQLKALYEQCQVLVAPSKAEGFGLPMAEAMLSGLAVITTGWGGQMDFCNDKTAWLVDYSFEPARTHFDLFDSVWAKPDVNDLAKKMREVYEAEPASRQERSAKGRQLLLDEFRGADVATRLVDAARQWARMPVMPQPKIGWVTTWNTRCGIAAYSAHLVENIPNDVTILAAQTSQLTQRDGPEVIRCWKAGEEDNLEYLAGVIEERAIDTVVVQFNYGFFNFEKFASFLSRLQAADRTIVLTMHATVDPTHVPQKRLEMLQTELSRCQRILVHAPADLNRLKNLGLVDNVALFPHGIRDFAPSAEVIRNSHAGGKAPFTIASYGFFLPHKGLLELVDAVALLRQAGCNVRLQMVNAEYPVPDSAELIQKAREKIQLLGLNDHVEMTTDYLPDDESLELLSRADMIVFPYQDTGESSSAAVRNGLVSARPVVVTPLAIFDDVAPAVFALPGFSPDHIAQGVKELITTFENETEEFRLKGNEATKWRDAHRYSRLGQRLSGMLTALSLRRATDPGYDDIAVSSTIG